MITKSIRWRLVGWLALLLVTLLAGFGLTAFELIRRDQLRQMDESLERRVAALATDRRGRIGGRSPDGRPPRPPDISGDRDGPVRPPPDGELPPRPPSGEPFARPRGPGGPGGANAAGAPREPDEPREFKPAAQTLAMFDETSAEAPYYVLWSRGSTGNQTRSKLAPADSPRPSTTDADSRIHFRSRGVRREAFYFTELGDCVLAGVSMTGHTGRLSRFGWWLALAGGVVLVTGVGGGWLIVSGALRPVEKISATATRIAAGELSERIDVAETESELGRLALVLNATFARLEAAFAEQRQFTADASHEMRTPLAVIISEAQIALARERSAPEYRETIQICLEAAQQMRRLAESLLQLARFDAGQEEMRREPVDLAELARSTAERLGALATERQITLETEGGEAMCTGDSERLQQVARNLVDNAIYYNVDGGRVKVRTWCDATAAWLSVTDTGRGIGPADLPKIFQRFFRADKSRSRGGPRSGLGLAICRAIVEAHGGEIAVTSELGRGTTFTVRLPRRLED